MIIDVHQHYADKNYYTDYTDFPAQLVGEMDRQGWHWTCLNGIGPDYHNRGNSDVARAVERFPDRLIGLGHLNPDQAKPEDVDKLKSMGMRGLKIIGTLQRYDCDDYLPFYERAAKHDMPILFHTGFLGGDPAAGARDESSDRYRPMTLDRIARLFPELPMIAAHMGTLTWFLEAIAVTGHHPNVYGDTSGGPASVSAQLYSMPLYDRIDWDKMMFGTDSLPFDTHIPFQNLCRLMDDLHMPKDKRQRILGGNAAKVFGIADGAA